MSLAHWVATPQQERMSAALPAFMKGGVAQDYKELGQSCFQWSRVSYLIVYTDILCWLARRYSVGFRSWINGSASDLASKLMPFRLQAGKEKWKCPLLFLAVPEISSWWRHERSQGWATRSLRVFSAEKIEQLWVITGVKQPQPSSVVDKAALLDSKLEATSYSNFPTLKWPFVDAAPPGYCCCGAVLSMSHLNFWGIKFIRGQSFRVKKNLWFVHKTTKNNHLHPKYCDLITFGQREVVTVRF